MDITARVWFKDHLSEESQYMDAAYSALKLAPSNHRPGMYNYDPYAPDKKDRYSEQFSHRFVFWTEGKDANKDRLNLKTFILLGKWLGGYVEVSIAGMDFYHLGEYIGKVPMDDGLSWEQEERLKQVGLKHPLDR